MSGVCNILLLTNIFLYNVFFDLCFTFRDCRLYSFLFLSFSFVNSNDFDRLFLPTFLITKNEHKKQANRTAFGAIIFFFFRRNTLGFDDSVSLLTSCIYLPLMYGHVCSNQYHIASKPAPCPSCDDFLEML